MSARTAALTAALLLSQALPAAAQFTMAGVSGSLRSETGDAFVLGAHGQLWQPSANARLVTTGSLSLGQTERFTFTPEVHFVASEAPLAEHTYFYVGGGPDFTMPLDGGGGAEMGLTMLAGLEWVGAPRYRFFSELRVHNFGPADWFEVGVGMSVGLVR